MIKDLEIAQDRIIELQELVIRLKDDTAQRDLEDKIHRAEGNKS